MSNASIIANIISELNRLPSKDHTVTIAESDGRMRNIRLNDPGLRQNLSFKNKRSLKIILDYIKSAQPIANTTVQSTSNNPTVASSNIVYTNKLTNSDIISQIISIVRGLRNKNIASEIFDSKGKRRLISLDSSTLIRDLKFLSKDNLYTILQFVTDRQAEQSRIIRQYSVNVTYDPVMLKDYSGPNSTLGSVIRSAHNILVYKPGSSLNWWGRIPTTNRLTFKDGWRYNFGHDPTRFTGSRNKKYAAIMPTKSYIFTLNSEIALTPGILRDGDLARTLLSDSGIVDDAYPEYIREFSINIRQIGGSVNIMRERMFADEISIEGVETNEADGDCVIKVLEDTLGERANMLRVKKARGRKAVVINILEELQMETRADGVTPEKLLEFCIKYDIRLGLCDQTYSVLCQNYPKKYLAKKGIFGMFSNSHLYLFNNKVAIDHIFSSKEKDSMSLDKISKKYTCGRCKKEFADAWLWTRHNDENHSTKAIISVPDIERALMDYIRENNRIPEVSAKLDRFYDDSSIYILSTIDETKEINEYPGLCKSLGMPEFSSIATLAEKLFEKNFANYKSHFNSITRKIFYSECPTPYVKQLIPYKQNKQYFQHDITKFYSAIMASMDAPIYGVLDHPVAFDGIIKSPAFYFSEQHGWIADTLARRYSDITHQLIPSKIIPADQLYSFINGIFSTDESLAKKIVCYLTGMLRKTNTSILSKPAIVKNSNEINYFHHAKAKQRNIDLDGEYALFQFSNDSQKIVSSIPIYNYIIQTGRAIMLDVIDEAKLSGHNVYLVSTDAIVTDKNDQLQTPNYFKFDDTLTDAIITKRIGKFKPIDAPENLTNRNYDDRIGFYQVFMPNSENTLNYISKSSDDPIEYVRYLYDDYATLDILDHIEQTDSSLLITGMPGCGKSYVAKQIKKNFRSRGIKYYEMSFQNNVCADMSNQANTFHKAFAMPMGSVSKTSVNIVRKFKKYQYVFLDEFQMTPDFIFPYLFLIKDECKCKFILSGDFNQWGPIGTSYNASHCIISKLFDNNIYEIKGNKRITNKKFVQSLEDIDLNSAISQCTYKRPTKYSVTYYSNPEISIGSHQVNIEAYERFTKLAYKTKKIKRKGVIVSHVPNYKLVANMPIICKKSNKKNGLTKGRHYIITSVNGNKIKITDDTNFHEKSICISLSKEEYFEYMDLGYAFTSHKSIGLTIKAPYSVILSNMLDLDANKRFIYVSLSRCQDPSNVKIIDLRK
jgi:hypothetical protein